MIANDDPLARWSSSDTTLDKPTVTVDADGNGLKARTGLNPPRRGQVRGQVPLRRTVR